MRILFAAQRFWPAVGGAEIFFQEMARHLTGDGHEVAVYTTDADDLRRFDTRGGKRIPPDAPSLYEGAAITRFRAVRLPLHKTLVKCIASLPLRGVRCLAQEPAIVPGLFRALYYQGGFDLVCAGVFPYTPIPYFALKGAKRRNTPFVMVPFVHTDEPRLDWVERSYTSPFQIEMMKKSDLVITQTSIERERLVHKGVPRDKLSVVGMGIYPDEMEGGDGKRFKKKFGIDGPVVLQVGYRIYDKGTLHTIEAMKSLWAKGINATLVLAGPSYHDARSHFESQPSRVKERCLAFDHVGGQEKKDMFHACDIFVLPSRTDSFGKVYLEAWLCRKPVIGALAGGVPDVITDGENGFLVPFGDVHMLAEYILTLLRKRELARSMGDAGHQDAVTRYTWDIQYRKLKGLFVDLASRSGSIEDRKRRHSN